MADFLMNRRSAITSLLAISAAGALTACGSGETADAPATPVTGVDFATPTTFYSANEMAFLTALSGTVMPKTETAGAVEAGVPAVLQDLASVWGDDGYRRYWREGIAAMSTALTQASGPDFVDMSPQARLDSLRQYDADVFDDVVTDAFYRDAKSTILQAYYMSELGATEELAYEPVPGEWIGCVPLSEFPKTWAT